MPDVGDFVRVRQPNGAYRGLVYLFRNITEDGKAYLASVPDHPLNIGRRAYEYVAPVRRGRLVKLCPTCHQVVTTSQTPTATTTTQTSSA